MLFFSKKSRRRINSVTIATLAVCAIAHITHPLTTAQTDATGSTSPECAPRLSLKKEPGAMIELDAVVPCDGNKRVGISNGPLRFSILTDAAGNTPAVLPALHDTAAVDLTDGSWTTVNALDITDVDQFHRGSQQSQGNVALEIHAIEHGRRTGLMRTP